jgi:hypothetical protein
VPGLLVFSLRLLLEILLAPLRGLLRRALAGGDVPEPDVVVVDPDVVVPEPAPAPSPPRPRKPPTRRRAPARPPRAEPTRGQVAAMREAEREAETGGADSVGADVHVAAPWPGYDEMALDDVLLRLQSASDVELAVVRAYERSHEARQAVLLAAGDAP